MITPKPTALMVAVLFSLCCGPYARTAASGGSRGVAEPTRQATDVSHDQGVLSSDETRDPNERATASEEDMFDRLTGNVWAETCARDHALPPSCSRIELRQDGTYLWLTRSDYVERADKGRWNFRVRETDSGVLFLSESGTVHFRLTEEGLEFEPIGLLHRDKPLNHHGSRYQLSQVSPPAIYTDLVQDPWLKANEFSSHYMPDRMQFGPDGRVALEYRGGECKQQAAWSLYRTTGRTSSWLLKIQPKLCDLRGEPNTPSAVGYLVKIADDMLLFGQPYYRDGRRPPGQVLYIEHLNRVTGAISDRLVAGNPVALDLTLENTLQRDVRVDSVVVSLEPLALEGNGFKSIGEEEVLATIEIGGKTLKVGDVLPLAATMTPTTEAKWARLSIRINGNVPWRRLLITTVHPAEPL